MNNVATKAAFDNVMNKFAYGNANLNGVYYDEENRRHVNSIRQTHALVGLHLAQLNMKDSAQKILRKYDNNVLESNVPYGMTSNRGNFHNRVSMSFLLAAYESGDKELAQKVNGSMKKDLEQQMKYYRSLGDDQPNEQLAINASNYMRQGGGNLSREQEKFVQDIVSSYQMLLQLAEWEKQYKAGGPAANPNETTNPVIGTDSPKVDTTKPNK
jgi:hypothetical protein